MSGGSTQQKYLVTSAITTGVLGLAFVLMKYRTIFKNIAGVFKRQNLPLQRIEVINTLQQCEDAIKKIQIGCTRYRVLGFDCEWVTLDGQRHPVALLQLASHDGFCALFRLCKIRCVPEELKAILEDLSILKVGVAPLDDARLLLQDYNVSLNGIIDLRHLALEAGQKPEGLASMASAHLDIQLDKNWRIRCSDWEAGTLTQKQVDYAATDAYVGVEIFKKLIDAISKARFGLLWSWRSIDEKWRDIYELSEKYIDVKFKYARSVINKKDFIAKESGAFQNLISDQQKESLNQPNFKQPMRKYTVSARSKPLYQNCYMQNPDGEILCTCDGKKANWYLDQNLATLISEDPLTIRLNFKPAGEGVKDVDKYYQMPRENHCVVCGKDHSYMRKNVVPREYRKLFPVIMKSHSSHDVLLLCLSCHQLSNLRDQTLRQRLGQMCDASIEPKHSKKYTRNQSLQIVTSAAKALMEASRKHVIPETRKQELTQIILDHFEVEELTDEILQKAYKFNCLEENPMYESHGPAVVAHFSREPGGLLHLEQMWREHFLSSMQPRFMPELWSVKHNQSRLEIRANEGRLKEEDKLLVGHFSPNNVFNNNEQHLSI